MQPIPRPQVLDPDRELEDDREDMTLEEHRARSQRLDAALKSSCEYGQQLWLDVARAREYLMSSLPPDPRDPNSNPGHVSTSPTGPDDEAGWQRWTDAYAELTSVLAGPHGDSGFGVGEARQAASVRRLIPAAAADRAPTAQPAAEQRADDSTAPHRVAEPKTAPPVEPAVPVDPSLPAAGRTDRLVRQAQPYLLGVLLVLAARGLRPRARVR